NNDVYFLGTKDKYSELLIKEGFKFINFNLSQKGKNIFYELLTLFRLLIIFFKLRPDYIFSFTIKPNLYSLFFAYFLNLKIVVNITGLGNTFINKNFINYFIIQSYKILLKKSHYVFFQNKDDLNLFKKKKLIKNNSFDVLPGSGIDTKLFNSFHSKNINIKKTNFIFCGRTIREKGIYEYCEASKIISLEKKDVEFNILGFNDYNHLKNKYNHINFLDSNNFNFDSLENFDCLILPSYREGLPRSVLEFSIRGIPSIVTDVPGCRSIIKNQFNGLICQPNSIKSLVDCIKIFLDLPLTTRSKMSYNARKYVIENYDENIVIDKYLNLINN
ncbi:MAG: hypothetical protein CMP16_01175, partial [Rickettsiales bacterium]|nr:hypothetical protein [Rickettsiales bacterium]